MLLPDKDAAIVVLTNSLALNDVADWIGQLILEELLAVSSANRTDIIKAAESCIPENPKRYPNLIKELADMRKNDTSARHLDASLRISNDLRKNETSARHLDAYVGTYWDDIHVFKIVVTQEKEKLYWAFQGLDSEKFELDHYEDDTFLWLQPRTELSRRGRWVGLDQGPEFWKARFEAGSDDKVTKPFWAHDNGVPPVQFTKE
ncbi:Peptidase S12, Pab87-related protein, partial [Metarhizium majus ARSEF 297]